MEDIRFKMLQDEANLTEVLEEEVVQEEVTEEVTAEIEQAEIVNQEIAPTEEISEEVKQPKKIELDTKSWLESNEDKLFQYLKEKKTDYSSLKSEELVARKFKIDNPELSDEDIKEELAEKYGIGLEKAVISEDEMTEEEILEAKAYNKSIDKLSRQLKKDAPQAVEYFNTQKQSLEVPTFEFEMPEVEKEAVNVEEIYSNYEQELIKQGQEYREKQWIPTVKENIQKIEFVTKKIEVEIEGENVILEVNYKPSEADKKQLEEFMTGYVANDYDNTNYVDANNVADLPRLFQDKAKEVLGDKLLKSAIVDALAKQKEAIYKKQVNYTTDIRDVKPVTETLSQEQELMEMFRNRHKR